jgi:hypothetical protein
MQSIFGALLTAGYATAAGAAIAASGNKSVTSSVESELTKSFASAADAAKRYPESIQHTIVEAAKASFLKGDEWAYAAGIIAVLLGAVLVFFKFPKGQDEKRLLAQYQAEDSQGTPGGAERAPELSGVPKAQPAGP